jgi:hypothetical protein
MTDILVGVFVDCQAVGLTSTHVSARNKQHARKVQLQRTASTTNNPRTRQQLTLPQWKTGLTNPLLTSKRHVQRRQ